MLHCSESDKLVQHNYTNRNCVIRNLPSTIPLFNNLTLILEMVGKCLNSNLEFFYIPIYSAV